MARSGKPVAEFKNFSVLSLNRSDSAAFSHDGRFFAFGTTNFAVEIHDLAQHTTRWNLNGHLWFINDVTFSPDDRLLASSSWNGDVRIWDLTTGEMTLPRLRGHGSGVRYVRFTSDAKTLISIGDDNSVRFWRVATGREMLILTESNSPEIGMLFSGRPTPCHLR